MDSTKYKVLVPHDFSAVAENAVNHGLAVARNFTGEVHLLHVVAKQKEAEEARTKLEAEAAKLSADSGVVVESHIRIGSIFEDIGDVASEIGASLIIMGTHGVKGIQHLIGSYAMKVIVSSDVPFIIVQEKGIKTDGYNDIVLPIDHQKESKQKLKITASMAKHFDAKIKIFAPAETDDFLVAQLNRELAFAKKFLTENNIPFSITQADEKGKFTKQVIHYASREDADLIAVVNLSDEGLMSDLFGSEEQDLIANDAEIPVLITNPTVKFFAESFG